MSTRLFTASITAITKATMVQQSANAVVMIRPHEFYPNPETAADNAFQQSADRGMTTDLALRAQSEFDCAVKTLTSAGITVHVFDDTFSPAKPDAIFPNNWFSTHEDGRIVLYPMYAPSRRAERRTDIITELQKSYRVTEVIDYSSFEERALCLEGTGSLVLDYISRTAYVSLSRRADREPLEKFCADFAFEPVTFESIGDDGRPIYHTNVMMCLGTEFALIGLEMISDPVKRTMIRDRLKASNKTVIELDRNQIANFVGNALELQNEHERLLVLSARAAAHLLPEQQETIERFARLVPLSLPTIELAGGSARCMLAAVHLPSR